MTTFDVFLSHAWVDQLSAERVAERPQRGLASELVRRLEAAGLSVFYDADDIHDGDQITEAARGALANAAAFVVWYSAMYPTRQACRWELTTATRIDRAMDRIVAINPEADGAHLTGTPLKDTRIAACPVATDDAAWGAIVDSIVATVRAADGTRFGEIVEAPVDWFPERQRPAARFTGRLRELWKLHELLTAHALTGQQQAIGNAAMVDGLAGSGKTVLVLEYAQRYAPAWPGGVVWLKGHGYTQRGGELDPGVMENLLRQELVGVAASLGIDLSQLDGSPSSATAITTLRALIGNALEGHGPVLWVVDDVHPGLSADLLQDWLAPGNLHEATSVITSRSTEYEFGIARLTLGALAPDEALWLLTKDQPPTTDAQRAAARQLVELLAGHPLAIDVTRAGINGPDGYAEWLTRMAAGAVAELDHLGQRVGSLTADHETSISATMGLSIERLSEATQYTLIGLAALPPLPIPLGIIDDVVDDGGAAAVRTTELAIDELERASLVVVGADNTVAVHRLVQLVAEQLMGITSEVKVALHERAAVALGPVLHEMRAVAVAAPYRHHHELSRALYTTGEVATGLEYWDACYLFLSGRYEESSQRLQHVLGNLGPTLGEADPTVLNAGITWAAVLRRLGRVDDAITVQETILGHMVASMGAHDRATIAVSVELAESYAEAGRYAEAIELGETAVTTAGAAGLDGALIANARARLGTANLLAGYPERAIPNLEAFVAHADSSGAGAHPDTLATRTILADAYATVGRFDEALTILRSSVQAVAEAHGERHPETLIARGILAGVLTQAGHADEAVALLDALTTDMMEVFGASHRETLVHRGNLAEAQRMAGRVDLAIDEQEALLVEAEAVFGTGHSELLTLRTQLASMYLDAERVDDAQREYEAAWRGRQHAQGVDNPETLISAMNLVFALWTGGRHEEAVALTQDMVRLAEAAGGHPDLESWRAFLVRATGG